MTAEQNPRLRLSIFGIIIVTLFAALFARLWYLQIMATKQFRAEAAATHTRDILEQAPRGRVYDRNGIVLVDNRISVVVTVDKTKLPDARRHPDANFICAHTGGDWERGIRILRESKNISAEVAGFDPTSGVLEMAVRELGPERVVYGSDVGGRSFASQLSKVMGADIPEPLKELVLGGNLRRLFAPVLRAKGYQA